MYIYIKRLMTIALLFIGIGKPIRSGDIDVISPCSPRDLYSGSMMWRMNGKQVAFFTRRLLFFICAVRTMYLWMDIFFCK